jgi:serine/threonine protein kinase
MWTDMALDSGARLGPYEIGSPLGSGGMGDVYRAREFSERFEREAKAISPLNHPQHLRATRYR